MMVNARSSNLLGKITILVMVGLCINTAVALDGSGTQEDPWRIQSLEDFNNFVADANYWDDYTRLETDVNLAGLTYSTAVIAPDVNNSGYPFDGTPFTGVFDGNDKRIINLTIDDGGAGNWYLGLFGCVREGGQIRNLSLEGGTVSGRTCIGVLVGEIRDCTVSNCYSTGDVNGYGAVGGLVGSIGRLFHPGTISNCYSIGDVSGFEWVGGLVGEINDGSISNCYSTGDVNGIEDIGGLVGLNLGSVSNCYSTGDVSGYEWLVGGLVGENLGSVSSCYSTGDVSGYQGVGGLLGESDYGIVSNCYSTGDVNGELQVGGLVGNNYSPVSNCYSTGDVNGELQVGGLVGWNWRASIWNCFWDTDTQSHGVTESIGQNDGDINNLEGFPTSQLHQQSTFTDWDFINVWNIGENQTYPYLRVYLPSDINKDRIVNFLDLSITANQWMQE